MSVQAYSYAMSITRNIPSRTVQSLLAHLADHADRFGKHVFPSVPTLAEALRCSQRTVQRGLRWLEEQGYIRRSADLRKVRKLPYYKRPTVYELSMSEETRTIFADEYEAAQTKSGSGACEAVRSSEAATGVTGPVTSMSPKPSYESSPLSPNGDIPPRNVVNAKAHEPDRDLPAKEPSVAKEVDAVGFIATFVSILASAGVKARNPRRSDRRAASRLLQQHDVGELTELVAWASGDGFWCGKVLAVRSLERRHEELRLARLHHLSKTQSGIDARCQRKRTCSDTRDGMHCAPGTATNVEPVAIPVSSATALRCPVFGYSALARRYADSVALARRHLDDLVSVGSCVICAYDERNVSLHGGNRSPEAVHAAQEEMRRESARKDAVSS